MRWAIINIVVASQLLLFHQRHTRSKSAKKLFNFFRARKTRFVTLARRATINVSHPLRGTAPRHPTHGSAAACFHKKQNKWFCGSGQ